MADISLQRLAQCNAGRLWLQGLDRLEGSAPVLTQELIAHMLGVRRAACGVRRAA